LTLIRVGYLTLFYLFFSPGSVRRHEFESRKGGRFLGKTCQDCCVQWRRVLCVWFYFLGPLLLFHTQNQTHFFDETFLKVGSLFLLSHFFI
jgi:hypothetical protein